MMYLARTKIYGYQLIKDLTQLEVVFNQLIYKN